jgi:intracellular multiplication protein IcmL
MAAPSNPRNTKPAPKDPARQPSPAPDAQASDDAQALKGLGSVVIRNEFYRDGYRSLLKVAVIEAMIILGLIAIMFYVVHIHQPENRYFATTEDGRLVPMVALNEPNLSTPALMSWTAQAATEVMTFGFHDYRRRLQEASRNFTRVGWASFTSALEKSRIIEMVEANQQVLTAAPRSAPVLVKEGLVNGRYQWQVELPIVVTYQAGSQTRADNLLLTLLIVRVPKLESPNGVGIEQWVAQAN